MLFYLSEWIQWKQVNLVKFRFHMLPSSQNLNPSIWQPKPFIISLPSLLLIKVPRRNGSSAPATWVSSLWPEQSLSFPTWALWLALLSGIYPYAPSTIYLMPRESPPIYQSSKLHLSWEASWRSPVSRCLQPGGLIHIRRYWLLASCYLVVWSVSVCLSFSTTKWKSEGSDCGLNVFCSTLCKYFSNF